MLRASDRLRSALNSRFPSYTGETCIAAVERARDARSLDAAIIALARRQHSVVTTAQLLGAGFDDSAVARPDPPREQPRDPPAQSLRLTSPAQTLEQLTGADYERAHNEALIRQLVPGDGRETMTRSEAERRVLALIAKAGLPCPRTT